MLRPVFTEKSTKLAKEGKYSFWVTRDSNKGAIKAEIARIFGVHVTSIKTINIKAETGRSVRGVKYAKGAGKKAIVTLGDKEKIDLFEEKKK